MTAEKRAAVTQLAARHGFPVVEDSPYRELRYTGAAPPRLVATSFGANVIVLTSLSKVLSPGLRIGYAVTDPATALALAQRAEQTYLSPAPLCQAIAARALEAGLLEENVARICSQLGPRRDAAVRAARESLGDSLLAIPEGGYYLSAHLAVGQDEDRFLAAARDEGVLLTRGSAFYPGPAAPPDGTLFLRLPFQTLEPQEFATGLERLSTARDSLAPV
jgi:DNA-binding transcriptional MocR family regulator